MARSPSELWRTSAVVFREAAFQSTYGLKLGGKLDKLDRMRQKDLGRAGVVSMWVSKGLLSAFIAGIAVGGAFAGTAQISGVPQALAMGTFSSMFLFAVMFMVAVMGLDMVTGLISSRALSVMALLPLARREVEVTGILAFVRIFDIPLVTGLLAFPATHLLLTQSAPGALVYLIAVSVTEAFGVVIALGLAEFFYAKVLHQPESGFKSIVRMLYMLIWLVPSLGLFLIFNFQAEAGRAVIEALKASPKLAESLTFVYPFTFGFLTPRRAQRVQAPPFSPARSRPPWYIRVSRYGGCCGVHRGSGHGRSAPRSAPAELGLPPGISA